MSKLEVKIVTIIGANGTMGRNVAAIYASFGNAKVYLVCRDIEKSKKAREQAVKSVRADAIEKNLIPADFSMLNQCVSESDIVVEHVSEDVKLKSSIMRQIAKSIKPTAIVCTGSSGLSITRLAECFDEETRSRFFGVHMFNPPYSLNLCELIPTKYSDIKIYGKLKTYLSETLHRTVVCVKDSPAFLGNRIGFQFINEAMIYAEKYKDNGGIDYIDSILGSFTGRTIPPLMTSDFVGLDVHEAIVNNLYCNTNDYAHSSFAFPNYAKQLVAEGKLGRKTGRGLYQLIKYGDGLKRLMVYDIASNSFRDKMNYVFPFSEKMIHDLQKGSYESAFKTLVYNQSIEAKIALDFLLKYVIYSLMAAEDVADTIHAADDVMATGFGWCPPLAVRDAINSVTNFDELVKEHLNMPGVNVVHYLSLAEPSHYDYRNYFKAKH